MQDELPRGGECQPWTLQSRSIYRVGSILFALFVYAIAFVGIYAALFGTPCKTHACVVNGQGPPSIPFGIAFALAFGFAATVFLSVAWVKVVSDGTTLFVTKTLWRTRSLSLASIKSVESGSYGPTFTLIDGTTRRSPIPQGLVNYGVGKATKARAQRFIDLVLADAEANRATVSRNATLTLPAKHEESRIFVDNQTDFRRRAYNQLTLSFGLTYVLCLGILVTALANHRLSAVVFVWIALVLLVLDVITLGWIAKTRKKVTADESQK